MTEPHECRQVRIAAMALADNESAPLDQSQIEAHVRKCDDCRKEIEWLDLETLFPSGAKRASQESSLLPAIQRRIEEETSMTTNSSDAVLTPAVETSMNARQALVAVGVVACLLIVALFFAYHSPNGTNGNGLGGSTPDEAKGTVQSTVEAREVSRHELEDGTILVAHRGTKYSVDGSRRITLKQGDVYLIVAKSGKPFVVKTEDGEVTATGTRFAVSTDKETSAAVAQGRVTLSGKKGRVELKAGEQGVLSRTKKPTREPAPRLSHVVSWAKDALAQEDLLVEKKDGENGLIALDPWGQESRLTLRKYQVDVHIEDGIARTTIDQTFFNHYPWNTEGTFYFPLPPDASVSRLAMYVFGQLNEGGMVERGRGQQIYNDILYQRRDPALLEMMEGNVFKMRIFPLEGRQEKRIFLSYTQKLEELYGTMRYWFPMDHTNSVAKQLSIRVRLKGAAGSFDPQSSTHDVATKVDGEDLVLEYNAEDTKPDQDFLLKLLPSKAPHGNRVATCDKDGFKFVFGRFLPKIPGKVEAKPRQWIVLNDVSASRSAIEARSQRYILKRLLTEADDDDSVFLIDVNTQAELISDKFVGVRSDEANRLLGHRAAAHLGATNLGAGIDAAARLIAKQKLANPHIFYVGDGVATDGKKKVFELVRSIPRGTTFVGVGVGKKVDSLFLQSAADRTGGMFVTINPNEDIDWRVFDMVSALNTPRLTKIKLSLLNVAGKPIKTIAYPSSRSLADGEALTVVARCDEEFPAKIVFEGNVGSKKIKSEARIEDAKTGADYIPRLWAKRHIDELSKSDMGRNDEIIELSKQYYVVTPFTSLIVLEDDAMYKEYNVERGRKDHWALYGAPKNIKVVKEPVDGSRWGWNAYEPGEDAKIEAKAKPKSVRDIVDSVQFRVNAPFYYWQPQPNGQGRYALYELLDGESDPTRLLTYWFLMAAGAEEVAEGVRTGQPAAAVEPGGGPSDSAKNQGLQPMYELLVGDLRMAQTPAFGTTMSTSGVFTLPVRLSAGGAGFVGGGGGFGGGFGGGGGGFDGYFARPMLAAGFERSKQLGGLFSTPPMAKFSVDRKKTRLPMLIETGRRRNKMLSLSFSEPALGFGGVPLGGVQPELLQSFQTEVTRRLERINRDVLQFNRQHGYWERDWGGWGVGNSIDLRKSANARWYGGLDGLLSEDGEGQSVLLPMFEEEGESMPALQLLLSSKERQDNPRAAVAWIDVYGESLNSQPGMCSVLAADYLLGRKESLTGKEKETELGPAEKKELDAIKLAMDDLGKASSRLEDSGPFWGHQGWSYRPQPWTFQEPSVQVYHNYNWSYDVTRYATGLYSNSFDILNEVVGQYGQRNDGQISDAAGTRIKAARNAIQPVTIRYAEDGPEVFVASGDRFALTSRNDMYLQERVVCDGEQIFHLYEELGLAARRPATIFRRASLRQVAPHLIESADSLTMRFNVQLDDSNDEGFTLNLSPIGQSDDAEKKVALVVRVLADGRIQDKTVMLDGAAQLRLAYVYDDGDVTARWFDKDDKELAKFAYKAELMPGGQESIEPDLSDYVVFDMPLRKPSYYQQQLETLGDDDIQAKIDAHRHRALALIQELNWRRWGGSNEEARKSLAQATQLMDQLKQPRRMGDLTLLGSAGVYNAADEFKKQSPVDESHPIFRFYKLRTSDWADARERFKDHLDGLLGHLAIYQSATRHHNDTVRYDFFAEKYPDSPLLLAATYYAANWNNRPAAWQKLYDHPKWQLLAMLMSAQRLQNPEQREKFVAAFGKMFDKLSEDGYDIPVTAQVANVLKQHDADGVWKKLTEAKFERAKSAEQAAPLLRFAEDAMSWGETELADRALVLAREQLSAKESLLERFALAQVYWSGSRYEEALKLYDEVLANLDENEIPASPALLASAARLAQQAGQLGRSIELEERALVAEHPHLPEMINLQAFRQRYNWLWQQYQAKIAEAVKAGDEAAIANWRDCAEAAWQRWYEVDPQNDAMAAQMATLQSTVGNEDRAWLFLSTVIDRRPRDAQSYYTVGQWYRGRGELDETEQWLAQAYQWDTANPRWLFERGQVLDELGRNEEADDTYRKVTNGKWAPGLQGFVKQAQGALDN